MNHKTRDADPMRRAALWTLATSAWATSTGCPLSLSETLPEPDSDKVPPPAQTVLSRIDDALETELRSRGLSIMVHGAWQIFHGILAFGKQFEIDTLDGRRSALEYFASGGTCKGFVPTIGDRLGGVERFGLRVALDPSTKIGQGHRDQWLAVVAQAGMAADDTWVVGNTSFRIDDWLEQALLDVPLNYEEEFSWTLIPLSYYRATNHQWVARDGARYSTELLLESEILRDLSASVCGGTHRLIGIANAVRNRVAENSPLSGVWARAREHLDNSIELARVNQNPDGSYSTSYMHRTGWCNDLGEMLGTTGHVLEFIATAGDDETLRSDWIRRSVVRLCDLLDQCRGIDLECGVLYHALHGLVQYRRRLA